MLNDHIRMEIESRLPVLEGSNRNLIRLLNDLGIDSTNANPPDDAAQLAAELAPIGPTGTVYRGTIEFPITITCFEHSHRRLCRVLYAISLLDNEDRYTGEPIRTLDSGQKQTQVLLFEDHEQQFVWTTIDDCLLPPAALRLVYDLTEAAAVEQERAAMQ